MSNFQSGPVNLKDDGVPLRWEDGARRVTVSGWACAKCGRFYGEDGERPARFCCHTDGPCETEGCANRKDRHRVRCDSCAHTFRVKRWDTELEQVHVEHAPAPEAPLSVLEGDEYFFHLEDLLEYCNEHGLKPSDAFLVHCRPHNPSPFSIYDLVEDCLPEETDAPEGASEVEKAVNAWLETHQPFSWQPDYKRRPTDDDLALLDKEYEAEADAPEPDQAETDQSMDQTKGSDPAAPTEPKP